MENPENKEEVFEAAREVLETLLDMMDVTAEVTLSSEFTMEEEDGSVSSVGLNIEGDDLGILIGRRGQTMASLQRIVRLIMACRHQVRLPIVLDVEGYKQRRCEGLRELADRLAEQVRSRRIPFTMEPMSPFERRVVHLALLDNPYVTTESVGEGEGRKVVILPKTG